MGYHTLRNSTCLILDCTDLRDAVAFAHDTLIGSMLGLTELEAGKASDSNERESNSKLDDGNDSDEEKWDLPFQFILIEV